VHSGIKVDHTLFCIVEKEKEKTANTRTVWLQFARQLKVKGSSKNSNCVC